MAYPHYSKKVLAPIMLTFSLHSMKLLGMMKYLMQNAKTYLIGRKQHWKVDS